MGKEPTPKQPPLARGQSTRKVVVDGEEVFQSTRSRRSKGDKDAKSGKSERKSERKDSQRKSERTLARQGSVRGVERQGSVRGVERQGSVRGDALRAARNQCPKRGLGR